MKKKLFSRYGLLYLISVVLMVIAFNTNCFRASNSTVFNRGLSPNGDGYFYGKLALSEQEGLFKNITTVAQMDRPRQLTVEERVLFRLSFLSYFSQQAYLEKIPVKSYKYYYSKTALHSFFYNLWNTVFSPEPEAYISFLKFQKSLLFAIVLGLMVLWLSVEINFKVGILTSVLMLFSPILVHYAGSLWFAPFTFFLHFLLAVFWLRKDFLGEMTFGRKHYALLTAVFVFHMLFHSFEWITAMGFMYVIPFIYYGLRKANIAATIRRTAMATVTYFIAVAIGMFFLMLQITFAKQVTFGEAAEFVISRYTTRTSGYDSEKIKKNVNVDTKLEAMNVPYRDVFKKFFNEPAFVVHRYDEPLIGFTYRGYIWAFLFTSMLLIFFILAKRNKTDTWKIIATIIVTWISILAPFSWFYIFKPHAYLHSHLCHFMWYLPFIFIGMMGIVILIDELSLKNRIPGDYNP